MTKQKKFKKRVRARMEETGERYTEAHAGEEAENTDEVLRGLYKEAEAESFTIDATVKHLIDARAAGQTAEVFRIVGDFHLHHRFSTRWGKESSWAILGSEVLDVLWPPGEAVLLKDMAGELRGVLEAWVAGDEMGADVWTPADRPEQVLAARAHLTGLRSRTSAWALPVEDGDAPFDEADDAFYEDGDVAPGSAGTMGLRSEGEILEDLWERAPDVSVVFDGDYRHRPKPGCVDPHLVREVARQIATRPELGGTATPDPGVDVHGVMGEMAAEIRRLRGLLADQGIDPDRAR